MKNTRKKLLVSSVAALLVSAMALSTATFAWFTQSTQATADKLSVKTVKSSELVLAARTGEWTDQLHYNYTGKVLKPASSADGISWFAATAAAKDNYAADTETITGLTDLDGYVFAEQLNVSNNGGADVDNVTISFSLTENTQADGANYLRLALVEADKRGADGKHTADAFKEAVYSAKGDSADAFNAATGTTTTITAKSGAAAEINIGKLTAKDTEGSTKYYNLFVWFEGQDTDCKDKNAGNDMPEITFTVTGDTVETTN